MTMLLVLALTTVAQYDTAGRDCFVALRDFQAIELREIAAKHPWPTVEQQVEIAGLLTTAYAVVADSLAIGATPVPGHPQALSWLRTSILAVSQLSGLVGPNAPKDARKKMHDVEDRFAALIALYPPGDVDEHPR